MFIISEGIYNTSKEISLKVRYLKISCLKIRAKTINPAINGDL